MYRFFVYRDSTEDNNVKIYSNITTQGKTLNNTKLAYKLKVPLIIKDCTVVKRDTLIYRPYENEIHAGLIVGTKMVAPTLEMSVNKHTFGVGYDPINKQPIVLYKFRLFGWTPKKRK